MTYIHLVVAYKCGLHVSLNTADFMGVYSVNVSTASIYRDLYPINTEGNTTNESNMCNNISTSCCSINHCNVSVKDQIKYFITGNNLFKYVSTYSTIIMYFYACMSQLNVCFGSCET